MTEPPLSMVERAQAASAALDVASPPAQSRAPTEPESHPETVATVPLRGDDSGDDTTTTTTTETHIPAGRDSTVGAGIRPVARGVSETPSETLGETRPSEDDEEEEEETEETTLIRAHSTPSLTTTPMPPPLRRSISGDVTPASETDPQEIETATKQQRSALTSDACSIESVDSDGAASSVASVAPTPAPVNTKANSYKFTRRDAPLRIFFPTDDLAMKAILSPPTLRGSRTQSATQSAVPAEGKPSLAESFLETTSRLFFLRGNTANANATATTTSASKDATVEASTPMVSRPSTTSIALEDDLAKLNNTVVAANPNLPPPPFANMFSCENCHEDIGSLLSQGRHHCRNCGGSFCAACSSKTSIVPFQLYLSKGEQRVCDGCFNRIREFHAQAQTTQLTWSGLVPPSSDVLVREFDLPAHETPVTIFNCSYFVDFAPFYGHLFLTREHVCFRGYKTHKIKIAFADLHSLIKPEFYYINALQINTKSGKEKHFFAEFNGLRDLCFLRTDQLVRAFQEGKKKEQTQPLSQEQLKQQAIGRRRSYKVLAAAAGGGDLVNIMATSGIGSLDMDDEEDDSDRRSNVAYSEDHDEAMSTGSSASDECAEPVAPDVPLSKMSLLLDCELRTDIQTVFELLWGKDQGRAFLRDHMEKTKDIDIDIEDWQPITSENEMTVAKGCTISKENDYTLFRNVRSQHPPKTKFPGLPPYAGCCRLQRLRVEKSGDGSKWTRFVVSDLLRMSSIPFSDYFEIETRWVFTRDGKNYCHVQAGLIVNFIKSTWFKSQIDSSTRSESKEGLDLWAKNAIIFLQEHAANGPVRSSLTELVSPRSVAVDEVDENARRLSTASSERSSGSGRKLSNPSVQFDTAAANHPATASFDVGSLLANPQSLLQVVTLVMLLYCVVVIRNQQVQLQRLSETTSLLLTKLETVPMDAISSTRGVCEQSLLDGAAAVLQQYFQSHQAHH